MAHAEHKEHKPAGALGFAPKYGVLQPGLVKRPKDRKFMAGNRQITIPCTHLVIQLGKARYTTARVDQHRIIVS